MGLFDLFKNKDTSASEDKELSRLQKMITNKLSQNLDREDALHRLAHMKSAKAAKILLTRFNWNLDPSIKDNEEKDIAVQGIVAAGEEALVPLREYCPKAASITWPLKALRSIVAKDKLEGELLAILDEFDTEYVRNPEPKIQLLQALTEVCLESGSSSDDLRIAVQPFLTDMNEEVRFAAVTTVLACGSSEALESLVDAASTEESLRVKNRIASGLVEQAWAIRTDLQQRLSPLLPPGFALKGEVVVGAVRR
ncbi:MAG TPA: HEAT repeat domain-containing protein [Polyangiaceae bacterium]|nr:HEAT repeat domain-containing protein [Polyangiaceae bacterium]